MYQDINIAGYTLHLQFPKKTVRKACISINLFKPVLMRWWDSLENKLLV